MEALTACGAGKNNNSVGGLTYLFIESAIGIVDCGN